MRLITYSLWGQTPKYNIGAIKNCDLAAIFYPNWISRFYIAKDVPRETREALRSKKNVELVETDEPGDWKFASKRFLPFSEADTEAFISRDCDSRISNREVSAVNAWLNSEKKFHIMRDHPYHGNFPILAGMFGAKNGIIKNINEKINEYTSRNPKEFYHFDQLFLLNYIWPLIKDDSIIHDEIFIKTPFPSLRIDNEFVGESFDENDIPDPIGKKAIMDFFKK